MTSNAFAMREGSVLLSSVRSTAASMSSWVSARGGTGHAANNTAATAASAMPVKALRQWGHFFRAGAAGETAGGSPAAGVFRSPDVRVRRDLL
jgi:hypothetical protein